MYKHIVKQWDKYKLISLLTYISIISLIENNGMCRMYGMHTNELDWKPLNSVLEKS